MLNPKDIIKFFVDEHVVVGLAKPAPEEIKRTEDLAIEIMNLINSRQVPAQVALGSITKVYIDSLLTMLDKFPQIRSALLKTMDAMHFEVVDIVAKHKIGSKDA